MKLGFVTYQIAAEWDVPTIIRMCTATGFSGVELRDDPRARRGGGVERGGTRGGAPEVC